VSTVESVMGVVDMSPLATLPEAVAGKASAAQQLQEFESLFVETLLKHGGLAEALAPQEGADSSLLGDMMLRELSRSLTGQLHLGLGAALGVAGAGRTERVK
jgi:Rod binding domain-containing protein